VVKPLDQAAGQTAGEEIENEGPEALECVQEGQQGLDGLLFDQEHPGLQVVSGLLPGRGGLEESEAVFPKSVQQVQLGQIGKQPVKERLFVLVQVGAMFAQGPMTALEGRIFLFGQRRLEASHLLATHLIDSLRVLLGDLKAVHDKLGVG